MKDILSLCLKLKKQLLSKDLNLIGFLALCRPLLSALANERGVADDALLGGLLLDASANEDVSDGAMLCGLLLDACIQSAISAKELPTEVLKALPQVDDSAVVKMKSGKLDKVSDDCLKLALGYLGSSDRCNAIERTCLRLFHLSRAVLIPCDRFDEVNGVELAPLKLSHRFDAKGLGLRWNGEWMRNGTGVRIASHFREGIEELRLYEGTDNAGIVANMKFPKLQRIETNSAQLLFDILSANAAVSDVFLHVAAHENNRVVLHCLSDFKAVRKVKLLAPDDERYTPIEDDLHEDFDFSHITHLEGDFYLFLRVFRGLRKSAPKLELLKTSGSLALLYRAYRWFSPKHFEMTVNYGEDDHHYLDGCLVALGSLLIDDRVKTLTITFEPMNSYTYIEGMKPFFVWLAQTVRMPQKLITLKMDDDMWEEVQCPLSEKVVDALMNKAEIE